MSLKGANSEGSVDGVKGQSAWQKGHLLSFSPKVMSEVSGFAFYNTREALGAFLLASRSLTQQQ